jgi:hypothetical protein
VNAPYTLTREDYELLLREGALDPKDEVEIVERYDDLYSFETRKALGIRAGLRTPPVR